MKLPFVAEAEVSESKLVHYLLNPNHPDGRGKARFFRGRGFSPALWKEMADALRRHALENEVVRQIKSPLGLRLVVEGRAAMPNGTVALVRSIRFIESGERVPRFVTAYPLRQRAKDDQRA